MRGEYCSVISIAGMDNNVVHNNITYRKSFTEMIPEKLHYRPGWPLPVYRAKEVVNWLFNRHGFTCTLVYSSRRYS